MPRIVKKTVFIFADFWEVMRTSRLLQVVTCGIVILAMGLSYAYTRYARQQREVVQIEQAEQEEKAAFTRANFNFASIGNPANTVVLGIDTHTGASDSFAEVIKTNLRSSLSAMFPDTVFASNVLLPSFYAGRYFLETFQEGQMPLQQSNFFGHADRLFLIQPKVWFKDSVVGDGMRSCSVHVICHAFHSLDSPMQEIDISLVGLGSTAESSLTKALETFKEHKEELEPLLK